MRPRTLLPTLLLAAALAGGRVEALENLHLVSDTVNHLERVLGVRARVSAWFGTPGGSTLNFAFPGKANVNFRLAEPAGGARYVDRIQVEPAGATLTTAQATAYIRFLVDDVSRQGKASCAQVRDDQDGMNAFIFFSCQDKAAPASPPMEVATTVQSIEGRNTVFIQFTPKKER